MKTILITGVNRGIGNAVAHKFLNKNWRVIGTVRNVERKINLDDFDNFQKEYLDVSDFDSMNQLIQKLSGQPIDILLNNAGVMDAPSLDEHIYNDESSLMNVYLVNTIAPYLLAEKLLPNLEMGSEKFVVSVSSLLSKPEHMLPKHWVYGSSKSALNYATKAFAENYSSVKVALVRPGWVKTDMGGADAPMNLVDAATIIANNIEHHTENIPPCSMVGPEGDVTYI